MKIVLFSLLCLILIGMTSYSYADFQVIGQKTEVVLPEVMCQLELRDSNGTLLTYIETEQIIGIDLPRLAVYLDNQNQTNKEFFIKDDKKYENQWWEIKGDAYRDQSAYSGTRLVDVSENKFQTLLFMRHDSFQTEPGDTVRIFWSVVRPAS